MSITTKTLHGSIRRCIDTTSTTAPAQKCSPASSRPIRRIVTTTGKGPWPRQRTCRIDRKSTRLNSSHRCISYAVFCLKIKSDGRSETTHPGQADRLLDMRRGGPVGLAPGPDLGLVGATLVPDADVIRGGAEHRKIVNG